MSVKSKKFFHLFQPAIGTRTAWLMGANCSSLTEDTKRKVSQPQPFYFNFRVLAGAVQAFIASRQPMPGEGTNVLNHDLRPLIPTTVPNSFSPCLPNISLKALPSAMSGKSVKVE